MKRLALRMRHVGQVLCLAALASGCSRALPSIAGSPSAPVARAEPWRAPAGVVPAEPPASATLAVARDSVRPTTPLALAQVVDLALRNNPQTQLSWAQARAGAAQFGTAQAAYFPTADASSNISRSRTTSQLGGIERTTISPQANISYLLFDFGGRGGNIAAARAAAVALDLTHNQTLQNVALQVEAAYFSHQAQRALLQAARQTVAVADTSLASARQRNQAGVATIADVLQAETVLAQATLDLETAQGNVQTTRGSLAVAMGVPANAPFELATTPDSVIIQPPSASVDTLIDRALALRPDLAAVRTQIQQAQAQINVTRSAALPSLALNGNVGKVFSNLNTFSGLNYTVTLGVQLPIFNLGRQSAITAAEAQVDAAVARAQLLRIQIGQQVYTAYYALQTATQRAKTTDALLASATRSETVALARYRAGVGTIVDLITAQSALANARALQAQSRWTWATALAQLSHDVGMLGPGPASVPLVGGDSTGVRR